MNIIRSLFKKQKAQKSIAILGTRGIPACYGGFETFAEELSVRLTQYGIDVTVYCEKGAGELPDKYQDVNLIHILAPRLGPLTTIIFDLLCLWHARKAFDVVYMLGYGTSIFCFLPRIWGTEVWINMDGVEWARSKWNKSAKLWFKLMETLAMWTPSCLIADAHGILKHLQARHVHLPPVRVISYGAEVTDNAPDCKILNEWQLTNGQYYLIVCRIEPENSVKMIIKGYLQSTTNYPLVVVGGIDPSKKYVSELLQLNDGRIRFIGAIYDKSKLQALRFYALAYFHGHTVGGTNPSLLEALGCSSFVVAHRNEFNQEVAGETAEYFSCEDDITEKIHTVESYPMERICHMKSSAQERIRKTYSWDGIFNAYLKLLEAPVEEQVIVKYGPFREEYEK
jgi:glycosyltransferase involved in cell wall biosynthesis